MNCSIFVTHLLSEIIIALTHNHYIASKFSIIKNKIYVFKFDDKNIMRKINPKSSDIDSFKYSILISLHYYDISFHPKRISKLKPNENQYNFIHITPIEFEKRISELKPYENQYNFIPITPIEFEINNPNVSLTIFDKDDKKISVPINSNSNHMLDDYYYY